MEHAELQERLYEYRDGTLASGERVEVERHLAACGECRSLLERWDRFASALRTPQESAVSERFVAKVMAAVEAEAEPEAEFFFPRWFAPAFAAAAAALLFALTDPSSAPLSAESLLLASDTNGTALLALAPEDPAAEDLLDAALGAP